MADYIYNLINYMDPEKSPVGIFIGDQGNAKSTVLNMLFGIEVTPARKDGDADLGNAKTLVPIIYKTSPSTEITIKFNDEPIRPLIIQNIGTLIADYVANLQSSMVTVHITGPSFKYMQLVDMPGLHDINSEWYKKVDKMIIDMNTRWNHAIWVFVSTAANDPRTSQTSKYLSSINKDKLMWIITKPDQITAKDPKLINYLNNPPINVHKENITIVKGKDAWEEKNQTEEEYFSSHPMNYNFQNVGINSFIKKLDNVVFRTLKTEIPNYILQANKDNYINNIELTKLRKYDTLDQCVSIASTKWKKLLNELENIHIDINKNVISKLLYVTKETISLVNEKFEQIANEITDELNISFRTALLEFMTSKTDERFYAYETSYVPACGHSQDVYTKFVKTYLIESRIENIKKITIESAVSFLHLHVKSTTNEVEKNKLNVKIDKNNCIIKNCNDLLPIESI